WRSRQRGLPRSPARSTRWRRALGRACSRAARCRVERREHAAGMVVRAVDRERELERHVVMAQLEALAQPAAELKGPGGIGVPRLGALEVHVRAQEVDADGPVAQREHALDAAGDVGFIVLAIRTGVE